MKTYALYMSPTGGTKKVLDIFTEGWQIDGMVDLSQEISEMKPGSGAEIPVSAEVTDGEIPQFKAEDTCIVAVPSFGGRVPAVAMERLLKIPGNGAAAVLIAVYGNRAYEDTLLELQEEMEKNGYVVKAAMAAVAEHSIMHQFGAGRPDDTDIAEIRAFSVKVAEMFRNQRGQSKAAANQDSGDDIAGASEHMESVRLTLPGNHPYKPYGVLPMQPEAGDDCTGCGICAKGCPVGAIDKADPRKTDGEKCISCMRCVAVCPKHGRQVNAKALDAAVNKLRAVCESRKENEFYI